MAAEHYDEHRLGSAGYFVIFFLDVERRKGYV